MPTLNYHLNDFFTVAPCDSTQWQAAINAMPDGGIFLIPHGIYTLPASLDFSGKTSFTLQGVGMHPSSNAGSTINGSSGSDLISAPGLKSFRIRDLNVHSGSSRSAIYAEECVDIEIANCGITSSGQFGILLKDNIFSATIRSVKLNGTIYAGIGLYTRGHTVISGCDITAWGEGIRACGATVNITGGRLETNRTALVLGKDEYGSTRALSRSHIAGVSLEANDVGILLHDVTTTVIEGGGIQGSTGSPSGQSILGLDVGNVQEVKFLSFGPGGSYSDAAIKIRGGGRQPWEAVNASNTHPTGKVWDVQIGMGNNAISFKDCNYNIRPNDSGQRTLQRHIAVQHLAAIDHLNSAAEGKNLRGKGIPVGAGALTKDIIFPRQYSAGEAAIYTVVPNAGGTLPAGTYYYVASIVTERGECGVTSEKTVALSGGNCSATIGFFGMAGVGWKRRIYRGRQPGLYDGYYEHALNSSNPFVDTGAPFDGKRSPQMPAENNTDMREPDANYAVIVTPSWETTVWVTDKATSGFVVHFGTPPLTAQTFDWLIVR